MKNKKAISDLIGWVLLIGFTITIAAFVTGWVIDQTKKTTTSFDEGLKTYCPEVVLGVEEIEGTFGASCGTEKKINILILKLKNKGKFTIWGIKGFGINNIDYDFGTDGLLPGETSSDVKFSFCRALTGNEIEIVPEIEVEDKKGYCGDNPLIINDNTLENIPFDGS